MPATYVQSIRSGLALAKQMRGDNTYRINCVYIEYQNLAAPGDTAVLPASSSFDGLEYFNNLAADYDFIRAPILGEPALRIASGYTPYYGEGEGNTLDFIAASAEILGELGRPFTNADNSKVYGLALVAAPDWTDRSRDIIIQRAYFSALGDQVLRPETGTFLVTYPITFGDGSV